MSRSRTPLYVAALFLVPVLLFGLAGAADANTLKLVNTLSTGGRNPVSVAMGDLDSDGATDVVVANFNGANLRVFLQTPSGGFAATNTVDFPLASPFTGFAPKFAGLDVGDVDGDGRDDIVAGDVAAQFLFLWRQTAPGVFTAPASTDATAQMWPLTPPVALEVSITPTQTALYPGWIPFGVASGPVDVHPYSAPYQLVAADLYAEDGSGTAEISAGSYWGFSGDEDDDDFGAIHQAEWRWGYDDTAAAGTFRLRRGWDYSDTNEGGYMLLKEFGPHHPIAVATGDFNNDGLVDLLYGGQAGKINYMRRNGGKFWSMEELNDMSLGGFLVRAVGGDLNDDDLDDAVVTSRSEQGAWHMILQDDLGRLGGYPPAPKSVNTTTDPVGVRIADLNDDGIEDLVIANAQWDETTGSVSVVPQVTWPDRARREPLSFERRYAAGRYPEDVEAGDFDGDGQNEVVAVNSNSGTLMYYDQVPPEPPGIEVEGGSSSAPPAGAPPASTTWAMTRGAKAVVWLSDTTPVIRFTEPDPPDLNGILGFYWVLDNLPSTVPTTGSSFVPTGTPITVGPLTSGTWYLHALSLDAAGTLGSEAAHFELNIDVTPPTAPVPTDGYAGAWAEADLRNVTWAGATDTASGVKDYVYQFDSGTQTVTTGNSATFSGLEDGTHTFSIKARDNAQPPNVSGTNTLIIRVDKGLPTCSITSPADGALVASTMLVSATASDAAGISKVEFYLDGVLKATDTVAPYSQNISAAGLAQGSHTITVRAYDMFGHTQDSARVVNVDTTIPRMSRISLSPNPFYPLKRDGYKDNLFVRFNITERAYIRVNVYNPRKTIRGYGTFIRGPGRTSIRWDGRLRHATTGRIFQVPEGTYVWRMTAYDDAGNKHSAGPYTVKIRKYVVVILSGNRVKLVPH